MRFSRPFGKFIVFAILSLISIASSPPRAHAQPRAVARTVLARGYDGVNVCIWQAGVTVAYTVAGTIMNSGTSGPWGPGGNGIPAGAGFQFPGLPEFCLVAVVNGVPMALGAAGTFPIGAGGDVQLVVNDDNYPDNEGQFQVVLTWTATIAPVYKAYVLGGCCTDGSGWRYRIDYPASCVIEGAAGKLDVNFPTAPGLGAAAVAALWAAHIMAQGSPDVVAYDVGNVLVIAAPPGYDLWIRDGGNWESANPGPVIVQAPNLALASGRRDRYRAASGITVQLHTGSIPPPSGAQNAPIGGPITTAFMALCLAAVAASGWRRAVARR